MKRRTLDLVALSQPNAGLSIWKSAGVNGIDSGGSCVGLGVKPNQQLTVNDMSSCLDCHPFFRLEGKPDRSCAKFRNLRDTHSRSVNNTISNTLFVFVGRKPASRRLFPRSCKLPPPNSKLRIVDICSAGNSALAVRMNTRCPV